MADYEATSRRTHPNLRSIIQSMSCLGTSHINSFIGRSPLRREKETDMVAFDSPENTRFQLRLSGLHFYEAGIALLWM